jgi:hypothetical protein
MDDVDERGSASGIGLWLRLALYAAMLPSLLVVPFGLGRSQTTVALVIAGLVLCIAGASWSRSRRAVARAFARSRLLRGADALLWNLAVILVIGELVLAVAGRLVASPLLVAPNANAQQRIEEARKTVFEYWGREAGNARGHNDIEPRADATDVVRIVALGDSFAYSVVGYEQNFLTRLESDLAERVGRPVEVVNLGLPGLQPKQYLQMLVDDGVPLHPDLVLVCLFSGNDFLEPGAPTPFDARNWRLVGFARRLARYAAERARTPGPAAPPVAAPKGFRSSSAGFSPEAYLEIATKYAPLLRRDRDPAEQRAVDGTLAILDELVARAAPTPVAIAVLPSELQVNPELRASALAALRLREEDLDLDRPARETRRHLEDRGAIVVDLLPALSAAERDGSTYALRDSHWNDRGNAVAALAIADALASPVQRIAATKFSQHAVHP